MTKAGDNYLLIKGRNEKDFSDFETLRQQILDALDIDLVDYVS